MMRSGVFSRLLKLFATPGKDKESDLDTTDPDIKFLNPAQHRYSSIVKRCCLLPYNTGVLAFHGQVESCLQVHILQIHVGPAHVDQQLCHLHVKKAN